MEAAGDDGQMEERLGREEREDGDENLRRIREANVEN